jgi:hypothetical protein
MMFHGNGGTAESDVKETGWMAKSDAAGFIAVFPEATRPDMTQPPKFGLRDFRRIHWHHATRLPSPKRFASVSERRSYVKTSSQTEPGIKCSVSRILMFWPMQM